MAIHGDDGRVHHHAPADLEHGGFMVPVKHHVPNGPRSAEVHQERPDEQQITQERRQDRRANQGMVFLTPEHVHQTSHDKPARGQGDPRQHVESDPEPPGISLVEVAHRTDASEKTIGREATPRDGHQRKEERADSEPDIQHRESHRPLL
jgi:hypothetical protein